MSEPNPPPTGQPQPTVRAQTLPLQGVVNRVVRGLLRAPLLCRLVGKRLITVYVVGRKSGRHYAVPVAYTRHNGTLLVGTPFAWARNLRTGEPVDIRLAGKRRPADVQVLTDEAGVVEHFAIMARDNHQFAKFNKIVLDRGGDPRPDDLHLAWAAGARVVLLTPPVITVPHWSADPLHTVDPTATQHGLHRRSQARLWFREPIPSSSRPEPSRLADEPPLDADGCCAHPREQSAPSRSSEATSGRQSGRISARGSGAPGWNFMGGPCPRQP